MWSMKTAVKPPTYRRCSLCLGQGKIYRVTCQECHVYYDLSLQTRYAQHVMLPCGHVRTWDNACVLVCPKCQGSGLVK